MKKRILSMILCACLVLGLCPVLNIAPMTAAAADAVSQIHNFTDDGFDSTSFYTFAGGQITNGKHGTFTYDFGSGEVTLNYALKFDSGGSATFTPTADGTVTIAVAAQSAGREVIINDGSTNVGTVTIDTAKKLFVLTVPVTAGKTYTVERAEDSSECGLYYIAYIPTASGGSNTCDTCSYGEVSYDWADDYSSCTASHTCSVCGNVETATAVSVTSETTATCVADGVTTYTATFEETWAGTTTKEIETTATGNHNYVGGVCSVCGAKQPTEYVHNFTASGKTSSFYTITGELSTSKGTVTYNNMTLTQCLKMESSTNISFTAPSAGTLTLVFVESSPNIKVDGTKVTGSSGIITVDVAAGSHTITKQDTMNLFYMVYAPTSTCNHSYGDVTYNWSDDHSTCTASRVCTLCNNDTVEETVDAVITAPNCAEGGTKTYTATFTMEGSTAQTVEETVEAGIHTWENGVCSVCKEECSHDWTANTGTCATCGLVCTHPAYDADDKCTVCGADEPDCAHTNTTTTTVDATCVADGSTTVTCDGCTATISTTVLPAHGVTHVEAKAATCTVDGNVEYWYCETCEKYYSDEACTSTLETVTLTAPGHSWNEGEETTAATCTEAGVMTYTCTVDGCGATKTEEIAAPGHSWVDGDILVEKSCIAAGSKEQTCTCGATQTVVIPAGHHYDENGVCTYSGSVLTHCGAVKGSEYAHDFSADALYDKVTTQQFGIYTVTGGQAKNLGDVVYNGKTMTDHALKMNGDMIITFTAPEDGVMIFVASESRKKGDQFVITTLNIAVNDGTTTTNYELAVPSDGIVMFSIAEGCTYTITQVEGENPVYYMEYVPGATLATTSSTPDPDPENPDSTPDVGLTTFVAEIGNVQYLSLADAVAAAKPGDIICMLVNTTETVGIGSVLTTAGQTIQIHMHGKNVGTFEDGDKDIYNGITAATGCDLTTDTNADDNTKIVIITRTALACEHIGAEPVVENEVAATCCAAGSYESVVYCSKCTEELSRETITVSATGIHIDANGDGQCDHGCGTDMSYVAYIDTGDAGYIEGEDAVFATLAEALEAAGEIEGGAIVRLLVSTSENYVIIPVGVTLDIEAYTLTADYVVGFNGSFLTATRYGNTEYGKLIVSPDKIVLGETAYGTAGSSTELPMWIPDSSIEGVGGYYVIAKLYLADSGDNYVLTIDDVTKTISFGFYGKGGPAAIADLQNATTGATRNITYLVRLTWKVDGNTAQQDFIYTAEKAAASLADGWSFGFVLTGYDQLEIDPTELTVTAMIVSNTGVSVTGKTFDNSAN